MERVLKERIGELKDYYQKEAPVYDGNRFGGTAGSLYNQVHFASLLQMLHTAWGETDGEEPKCILEIAVGTGRTGTLLTAEGFSVFGLDIAPEMLQIAKGKEPASRGLHFICGDAFALPFPKGTFDAVVCSRMLQMIPREYYADFGKEVEKVLKLNGLLVVELWNDVYNRIRNLGGAKDNSQGMRDTFMHPKDREGLFGTNLKAEGLRVVGFPLVLRVASRIATRPCLGIYMMLSRSSMSRYLGETLLVQYRKQR